MNQSITAEKLGISKSHLSEIESGKKKPSLDLLEKYGQVFDVPLSSIMFFSENVGKGPMYEKARRLVAGKLLKLLKYIDERAETSDA
jgi:transcriptional regulator with XRE-family HTH domain